MASSNLRDSLVVADSSARVRSDRTRESKSLITVDIMSLVVIKSSEVLNEII